MERRGAYNRSTMRSLLSSRAVFVSGKGGVGKTTVAAALALASARSGRETLLAEVEQREGLAPIFGLEKLGHTERRIEPHLQGISIEPDESLVEYLQHFYRIPRMSRALVQSRAVEFATQVAPGLRDILLVGRLKEAEVRVDELGKKAFEQIVVDSPPTGRLPRFLDAPRAITEIVPSGPVGRQARGVLDMISSEERAQVVLVTLPEELPLQETLESVAALREIGVATGPVVCNQVWPRALEPSDRDGLIERGLAAGMDRGDAEAMADVVARAAERAERQHRLLKDLEHELGSPPIVLPYLFVAELRRGEVETMGRALAASGRLA
jgi:anion-transporting  ArsA/GET3 family ATPase